MRLCRTPCNGMREQQVYHNSMAHDLGWYVQTILALCFAESQVQLKTVSVWLLLRLCVSLCCLWFSCLSSCSLLLFVLVRLLAFVLLIVVVLLCGYYCYY